MKKQIFNKPMKLTWLFLLALITIVSSCKKDDNNTPTPLVEDGIYVKGAGTALTDLDAKGIMKVTKNEKIQKDRSTLLELYVAVKAGADGFNIVKVSGSTQTVYGPGTDFAKVATADIDNEEPKDGLWKGSYAETTTPFTVPEDGLYHVVIETELGKVTIAKVNWGLIGAATPGGWGESTAFTAPTFDLNTMTYTLENIELRQGDWKLRYSNGWKILIDTTVDLGEGKVGVNVNTNFGGAVDALVAGGDNIINDDPAVYSVSFVWTLGSSYALTLTKTGDLPGTNWTGVVLDIVGDGVSADNTTAYSDTSSWHWGNAMVADNDGIPTVTGQLYEWNWSGVILVNDAGFKVRTLNGVAPPTNGANFDAGLEAVDHANSSANVAPETEGNLSVTTAGTYNIKMVIDAANNDAKTITITDAK